MKFRLLYGLAAVSLLLACQSNSYQINGFARAFQEGDTVCLATESPEPSLLAQTVIRDGKFLFKGETDSIMLCRTYMKHEPDCDVVFFLESGNITIEINPQPDFSRVSGTIINNEWQRLADSVQLLANDIFLILKKPAKDSQTQVLQTHSVDSLHRRMSDCILHTAQRNSNNPLGRYIMKHYKKPEFK